MQSRNIIIGILGVLLIFVAVGAFYWNSQISEENAQNQQRLTEQTQEIGQLKQAVEQFGKIEVSMQELKEATKTKDETIASLNQLLEQQTKMLQEAVSKPDLYTELQEQIKSLQQKLEAMLQDTASKPDLYSNLQEQIKTLQQKLDQQNKILQDGSAKPDFYEESQEQIKALQQKLEAMLQDNTSKPELYSNLQEQIKTLQQKLEMVLLEARSDPDINTSLQTQIKSLQDELERRKKIQDALSQDAQEEIDRGDIQITQRYNQTVIRLEDRILFDTGRADLKQSGVDLLEKVAFMLRNIKDHEIQVEGHTDNRPIRGTLQRKYATNWELSAARSTQVVRYLVEKLGVNTSSISAAGFGPYRPVVNNETPQNQQINRRVEFVLRPILKETN